MDILVFAGDISDAAQQRRIASLRALGHRLRIISFRKSNTAIDPSSDHLDLGQIGQQRLVKRALKYLSAMPRIMRFLRRGPIPQITLARNLDMVCLALLSARRSPVIYECLDIHGVFVNGGMKQHIARWIERAALRRIDKLLVSAPRFITEYFNQEQGYSGDWHLLENKLWLDSLTQSQPIAPATSSADKIRLGWVGNIRCQNSFAILMKVADKCPNVEIHIFGHVHQHALQNFKTETDARGNVWVHGAYEYPTGLNAVYSHCDLVWAQDLWQTGNNSDWLLPNRIYEAAWHGCPSIAVTGTATAQKIIKDEIGYAIQHPTADALISLLNKLDPHILYQKRCAILSLPETNFIQSKADVTAAITIAPVGLPNFIGIGAMRAGTTTLYNYCADHPGIGVSAIKETDFFISQKNWHRGIRWYKSLFPKTSKCLGEFSPNYAKAMVFGDVPQRIHGYLPDAKLIYIVRHPVDRAISQYVHSYLSGMKLPDLETLVGSHEWHHLIDTSSYAKQLNAYQAVFPSSQIMVLNLETLQSNPKHTLAQVAQFLNVENNWNTTAPIVENTADNLANMSARSLRVSNAVGMVWVKSKLPVWAKNIGKKLMHSPSTRTAPVFNNSIRQTIWDAVETDMDEFTKMTGIKFDPPNASVANIQNMKRTA
jgi:succinoglycan biosynthesis protein ExoL